jgi:hypothetical protein
MAMSHTYLLCNSPSHSRSPFYLPCKKLKEAMWIVKIIFVEACLQLFKLWKIKKSIISLSNEGTHASIPLASLCENFPFGPWIKNLIVNHVSCRAFPSIKVLATFPLTISLTQKNRNG